RGAPRSDPVFACQSVIPFKSRNTSTQWGLDPVLSLCRAKVARSETVSAPIHGPGAVDVVEENGALTPTLHCLAERPVVVRPSAHELADGIDIAHPPRYVCPLSLHQVKGSVYDALVHVGEDPAIGGREHDESIMSDMHVGQTEGLRLPAEAVK